MEEKPESNRAAGEKPAVNDPNVLSARYRTTLTPSAKFTLSTENPTIWGVLACVKIPAFPAFASFRRRSPAIVAAPPNWFLVILRPWLMMSEGSGCTQPYLARSGMSAVSFPVTRPCGRALLVGNPASRSQPLGFLTGLGYVCEEADDPYSGFGMLCRRPAAFSAVVISLASIYRDELQLIASIKRLSSQIDVWLTQTDGRQALMAEALRLGADGLLSEDGLHRIGLPTEGTEDQAPSPAQTQSPAPATESTSFAEAPLLGAEVDTDDLRFELDAPVAEPVLTADELRALLHEEPSASPPGAL